VKVKEHISLSHCNHVIRVLVMPCSDVLLAADETEVTVSQDDSSGIDDEDEGEGDADDDGDDDDDDKEWMNEASDMSLLDSSHVLTTRQVTVVYVAFIHRLPFMLP